MAVSVPSRGLLAIDRAVIAYLAVTGLWAAVLGGGPGLALAAAHAAAIGVVWWMGRRPLPARAVWRFSRLAYGVAICPLFYTELAWLNRFLTSGYFDPTVQAWELALFGSQLSVTWAEAWPSFLVSEALHLGYFAYYAIVPLALIGTWVTRGPAALHRVALTTAVAFFVCYSIFLVFPVAGPRYEFAQIEGVRSGGTFFQLVHSVLEGGSSRGTAFPSSHIAASGAAVLGAGLEDRRWLWVLLLPELALAAGTVYGRFHYGVDALAGALLAVLVVLAVRQSGAGNLNGPSGIQSTENGPESTASIA